VNQSEQVLHSFNSSDRAQSFHKKRSVFLSHLQHITDKKWAHEAPATHRIDIVNDL
jgi:hypothetical protein